MATLKHTIFMIEGVQEIEEQEAAFMTKVKTFLREFD